MIGKVFNGRYRITERIGIGGMAEVYKAQDQTLGRIVAVKVMLPQYASDPEFAARFRQEAASAANLQSPYIVNVYDWGQDNGIYFIVMEFVRGTDLKSAIEQRGAINQRKVAEIGSQVCQALTVAHGQDIIHRDIKPQNIMVQPDGNVKVMDFGIARAKNSVKTQTSSVLGTAHYISPEQAQGKELTGTSDMYSLGCVLYEAATGQLPFDGPDAVSVAMKQVNEDPVFPSQVNPDIHPDLEAIIMKALNKNPNNRFQTARDMRAALDDFLMGRPVNLGAASMSAATTTVMNKTDATAVMTPVDGKTVSHSTSYKSQNDTEQKSNKKKIIAVVATLAALLVVIGIGIAVSGLFSNTETPTVPDVSGKTEEAAIETLEAAGYVVGEITEEYDTDTVEGRVIGTDPEAGTELEEGETVNIILSLGTETGTIPDLTGMTADEAEAALEEAGFDAQYAGNEDSDEDENTVSSQDPAANTEAEKGSTVKYWISTGPGDVEVPDVLGKTESSATTLLESEGFSVTTQYDYDDSGKYGEGTVMSQSPSSGSSAASGSTVTLTISKGTSTVSVTNVVGKTQSEAEEILGESFAVTVKNGGYSDDYAEGVVMSQSPSSGKLEQGGSVTIYISQGPEPEEEEETDTSTDDTSSE